MSLEEITCECLVIGSGPGGAVTAYVLAQAGRDVILVEEGDAVPISKAASFSLEEMDLKYRHAGLCAALGNPKVAYLEGCCVGGASEINAGLYHRPLAQTLDAWAKEFQIKDFSSTLLEEFFKANEEQLSIAPMPQGVGLASQVIARGAAALGWQASEVPRLWQYIKKPDGAYDQKRQSMSETLIPLACKAGCRLLSRTKVQRLNVKGGDFESADVVCKDSEGNNISKRILARQVIVCAGAIQTPFLLRKSGITRHVGNSLRMHPAVRVISQFKDVVNASASEGVPVYQVQEFKPRLTLGGSYSGVPHLALWLAGSAKFQEQIKDYARMAIFYALIVAQGKGSVRHCPGMEEPLVSLPVLDEDLKALGQGLYRLGELLFAAGAQTIYSPLKGQKPFCNLEDMRCLQAGLPRGGLDLSTIHLFCSCPMGEDTSRCAVDSYGRLHGARNIYLNDASILPASPGVNPQAVIMAVARRNAEQILKSL